MAPYSTRVRTPEAKQRLGELIAALGPSGARAFKGARRIRKMHYVHRRGRTGAVVLQAHIPPGPLPAPEAEAVDYCCDISSPPHTEAEEGEILAPDSSLETPPHVEPLDDLRRRVYDAMCEEGLAVAPATACDACAACPSLHLTIGVPRDCITFQCDGAVLYENGYNYETEASERRQLEAAMCVALRCRARRLLAAQERALV